MHLKRILELKINELQNKFMLQNSFLYSKIKVNAPNIFSKSINESWRRRVRAYAPIKKHKTVTWVFNSGPKISAPKELFLDLKARKKKKYWLLKDE